jgi:DNA-binding MarR family transcriptional regulator
MTTNPTVNGQIIGQAHYATRAVLDGILADVGISFHQSIVLSFLDQRGGSAQREAALSRLTGSLKIEASAAEAIVAGTATVGLITDGTDGTDGTELTLTEAGRRHHATVRSAIAEITARLYGDFPAEELAIAGRILTAVTDRANAELAGGRTG